MGWPFATWLDWTRKHEAAPTPVWSRIQMFSQKGARPCGQTRAFKAAEKQCVNRGAAHAGLIRACCSPHLEHLLSPISTRLPKFYSFFETH